MLIMGGREHAHERNALLGWRHSVVLIPYDVLKEMNGIEVKGTNGIDERTGEEKISNASRLLLDDNKVDFKQFDWTFDHVLPDTKTKKDIAENPALKAMAVAIYTKLLNEGKLPDSAIGQKFRQPS